MLIGWLFALRSKNASYVDVLWAYGVGVLGLCFLVIQRLHMLHEAAEKCQKRSFELDLSKKSLFVIGLKYIHDTNEA